MTLFWHVWSALALRLSRSYSVYYLAEPHLSWSVWVSGLPALRGVEEDGLLSVVAVWELRATPGLYAREKSDGARMLGTEWAMKERRPWLGVRNWGRSPKECSENHERWAWDVTRKEFVRGAWSGWNPEMGYQSLWLLLYVLLPLFSWVRQVCLKLLWYDRYWLIINKYLLSTSACKRLGPYKVGELRFREESWTGDGGCVEGVEGVHRDSEFSGPSDEKFHVLIAKKYVPMMEK